MPVQARRIRRSGCITSQNCFLPSRPGPAAAVSSFGLSFSPLPAHCQVSVDLSRKLVFSKLCVSCQGIGSMLALCPKVVSLRFHRTIAGKSRRSHDLNFAQDVSRKEGGKLATRRAPFVASALLLLSLWRHSSAFHLFI